MICETETTYQHIAAVLQGFADNSTEVSDHGVRHLARGLRQPR